MKLNHQIASSLGALTLLPLLITPSSAKDVKAPVQKISNAPTWAQDSSDIASDSTVIYGKLPNGMKYILMPNKQPPGRVSMRLHIASGSLMEREDQRGVAHFLEHMVFNGSKHFPDSSQLIPKMQRLGIAFGAHANAYTSFGETVYMLDLPNNHEDTLELGFDIMRDFGDGAFLKNEEIDKERGVILSEKTSRDSVQSRLMHKQLKALLPESKIGNRFPIGLEKIITSAPRSAFSDFYTQYYTPSRMTFIYVGDFDPKQAEKRIIESFKSMKNPVNPGQAPDLGKVSQGQGFQTLVLSDKEVSSTDLTLSVLKPFEKKPDTKATRAEKLPLNLANAIINRRFSILSKKENATISGGVAYQEVLFDFAKMGGIGVDAKDNNWKAALPVLEQELRRAITYGFTENELNESKANLINIYEQAVKAAPSRKTPTLASSLARHVHKQAVFSSTEDDLNILRANLAKVTPEICHKAFAAFWETPDITLILTTNKESTNAKSELLELYTKSKIAPVSAPEKKATAQFAYTDFGPAGKITATTHIKDLDFTQLEFANGCKCNIKHTDFTKNTISMMARVGAGNLTMPVDKPGLSTFSSAIFTAGGLAKHNSDDLSSILAGHNAGVRFNIADDAFVLDGVTTPKDLELQLQLLCAYLTDPGFRPEALRLLKAQIPSIYSQIKHTSGGAQTKLEAYLHGNDPRFVFPERKQLESYTLDDAKKWILPALKNDVLELSISGDLDEKTLLPILARTIGALPKRSTEKPAFTKERLIKNRPATPAEKKFTFESKIPTGSATVIWKGPGLDSKNIGTIRRMGILRSILSNRMREKIREELGEAYSPYAYVDANDVYKELGFLIAVSPGKPEQSEKVGKTILEIGQKLADEGATEDELKRALAPRLTMLEKSLRENSYWLGTVMAQSQEQPYRLDWARTREKDYAAITLGEINALAKKYLGTKNAYRIEILPTK